MRSLPVFMMLQIISYIALTMIALYFSPSAASTIELPGLGDTSGALISPEEERQLGEEFMREVRHSLKVVDDPELTHYLQSLGSNLASRASDFQGDFTLFLVMNPAINAFAAPGGYIGIHTGLITSTQSESELASVLAHEIAHITQRHLPRALEEANKMSVPATAALLAAIILGRNSAAIGEAALATTLAGQVQAQINFTRGHEQEADRIGMQLLADSGFDPRGMPAFFERLQASYRFYDNQLPEFLSTHPVTTSRIADSRSRAEQFPPVKPNSESLYPYMQAKTRVLSQSTNAEKLAFFTPDLKSPDATTAMAARYGSALVLIQANRYAEARELINDLIKRDPERIPFIMASAQLDMAEKKYDQAIRQLRRNLDLFPGHPALTYGIADAMIQNNQAEEARQILQEYMRQRRPDPALFKLSAQAATNVGRRADAHYAMAEYYYYSGETSTAVQQLKLALSSTPKEDYYLTARIEARLKELQAKLPANQRDDKSRRH